jgi:hypothetical protein
MPMKLAIRVPVPALGRARGARGGRVRTIVPLRLLRP